MLKKYVLLLFFITLVMAINTAAQKVYTPSKDSTERKGILNALRIPIEKELKKKTIFEVQTLNVQGSWAFFTGVPKKSDGSKMDYQDTIYQEAIINGVFDDGVVALFKKTGNAWKVVTFVLGPTDVPYVTWWRDYKAPKTIFPYTE